MSSPSPARREGAAGKAPSRAERIEKRLDRYPAKYRAAVRARACEHSTLADLALSFPALLFALAVPRDADKARRGVEAVCAGRSLRQAAGEIGLPMWLRGLPPEAFAERHSDLPDGPLFALRIANHLPRSPRRAADWLQIVEAAARWGDETIAVWVAREFERRCGAVDRARLLRVCLWAWTTTRGPSSAAALSARRWSPEMDFKRAMAEAADWLENVDVACTLGANGLEDGWLQAGRFGDFDFAPLLTPEEVIAHARAMQNCVRTYAGRLRRGRARVWAVQRDGKLVAMCEVSAYGAGRFVRLAQACARQNRELTPEVERAIHEWLRGQPLHEAPEAVRAKGALDRATWVSFWRPYWIAKRRLPDWLPLSPQADALRRLRK